jgi:hypothetical protein|tara:strand:+ start:11859 stop:12122 length:264 start_codon:yes stop_codon:yes gene_type:complete
MKKYLIKKLISGYRINPSLSGMTLVGIPHNVKDNSIQVQYADQKMIINSNTPLLGKKSFKDKFGRDKTYILYYYEWTPNKTQIKLEL